MKKRILFILMLMPMMAMEAANRLPLPYVCSFEQGEDLSHWTLNDKTPMAVDQWCVNNATSSEGDQALYVSYNGGLNARYGYQPNTICAYMTFQYPASTKQEKYDISFDWRNFGDEQKAQLRVWYGPLDNLSSMMKVSETSGATFTTAELNNFRTLQVGSTSTKVLYNSESWKTATFSMNVSAANADKDWVLMFMWINQTADSASAYRLAACIDNIQIVNANVSKPEHVEANVNCDESAIVVSWESGLTEFSLAYKSTRDEIWHRQNGITDQVATTPNGWNWSYSLYGLTEGVYDIKLWGVKTIEDADPVRVDTSMCVQLRNVVNYCGNNHCIDYMHLDAPNVVCTYGTYDNPYADVGIMDFGSQQKASRHTIMSDPFLTDERTNNKLLTVPEGASASVRLGNWDNGAEAESITYEFTVDEDQCVLLLNYAIVLEDPEHGKEHQPYFRLRILNEQGSLIDACAMAEYYAGYGAGEWLEETYIEKTPMSVETHKMLWKNWSTVGLNLSKYAGQRVHVELTTKDCSEGMHFGYAYFTLDCTAGRIQTNNCTGAEFSEATAPEGFDYEWQRDADHSIVSNQRSIQVDASDESQYTCKCMFKENHDCYFKLQTYFIPEYPKASFQPETQIMMGECKTELKLKNTSYIWYEESGQPKKSPDLPQSYEWNITTTLGQTQTSVVNPTISCNPDGDTVLVALTAYLSSKNCNDDTVATIIVPRISTPDSIYRPRICKGEYVLWEGRPYTRDTMDIKRYTNQFGCDSVLRLDLKVLPRIIEQKWNDVLALLNTKYNGGYEAREVRWYRNGVLLEEQTGTYIYAPEGLINGDEYYAEIKTQYDDILTTCPIIVQVQNTQSNQQVTKRIVHGKLQIQVNENIYNAQGILITTAN